MPLKPLITHFERGARRDIRATWFRRLISGFSGFPQSRFALAGAGSRFGRTRLERLPGGAKTSLLALSGFWDCAVVSLAFSEYFDRQNSSPWATARSRNNFGFFSRLNLFFFCFLRNKTSFSSAFFWIYVSNSFRQKLDKCVGLKK